MPKATKRIIFICLIIGILIGVVIASFIFPRTVTTQNEVFSETIVYDTIFIEKQKIVYKTKYIDSSGVNMTVDDTVPKTSPDSVVNGEQDFSLDTNQRNFVKDSTSSKGKDLKGKESELKDDQSQEIRVAKNELLETRFIIPEGNPNNFYCQSNSDLDSLLVDNYTTKAKQEGIQVEFWRSPINTVGYKLGMSKLVLYGFYEFEQLGLRYMQDGSMQMTYMKNTYRLDCGSQFRTLIINK